MEVLMVVVLSVNALGFRARKKPTLSFTGVLPIEFCGHQPKSPLRDLCATLSPLSQFLRPEATVLPIKFLWASIQIPPL
jgi:hypothetical protein